MALSPQVKSAIRPLVKLTKAISPTGVGVLLSVGAHVAFLTLGPKTNLSFAALTEAAQQADAEETIVPLVQLTPAEQNRLPDFDGSRQSPELTGLGSLALPSGLPFEPNTSLPERRTAAAPFPSATLPQTTQQRINSINSLSSGRRPLTQGTSIPLPVNRTPTQTTELVVPPAEVPSSLPDLSDNSDESGDRPPTDSNSDPTGTADDLRTPEEGGRSLDEILAAAQRAGTNEPETDAPAEPESAAAEPTSPSDAPTPSSAPAAQGNPSQLRASLTYDSTGVSEEEAEANTEAWLAAISEEQGEMPADTAELTIDSQFKACREVPPADALVGVVVNPDGTQENATILKSTGYEVLNRQALEAVENADFDRPEVATRYQVQIDVIYKPAGCAQSRLEGTQEQG
ncbi:energy transducer TonB [Leptolyngbya sp. BC1307]|uniref:energy transducer TonB family protein n=1 Tax=Leptolyngbya sp. BC1307 TaxID=2029589 RepID=UPI000EFD28A7|nr:energy transducer TonB [Leptolyngbya sp. BC1307]